mmetsp:Transcript_6406/g.16350  ORF Transcript_6406/g.16350 Transcript_6406/m.16350 type:complete len:211 (+) Transcript_6406:356-988(+)
MHDDALAGLHRRADGLHGTASRAGDVDVDLCNARCIKARLAELADVASALVGLVFILAQQRQNALDSVAAHKPAPGRDISWGDRVPLVEPGIKPGSCGAKHELALVGRGWGKVELRQLRSAGGVQLGKVCLVRKVGPAKPSNARRGRLARFRKRAGGSHGSLLDRGHTVWLVSLWRLLRRIVRRDTRCCARRFLVHSLCGAVMGTGGGVL